MVAMRSEALTLVDIRASVAFDRVTAWSSISPSNWVYHSAILYNQQNARFTNHLLFLSSERKIQYNWDKLAIKTKETIKDGGHLAEHGFFIDPKFGCHDIVTSQFRTLLEKPLVPENVCKEDALKDPLSVPYHLIYFKMIWLLLCNLMLQYVCWRSSSSWNWKKTWATFKLNYRPVLKKQLVGMSQMFINRVNKLKDYKLKLNVNGTDIKAYDSITLLGVDILTTLLTSQVI